MLGARFNVRAGVRVGRRDFLPAVRELDEEEAVVILAGYERRNRLVAPLGPEGLRPR